MTTQTLTEFLLARIAEDESEQTQPEGYRTWHRADCAAVESEFYRACDCGLPARVLAECKAKRRIVDEHYSSDPHDTGDAAHDQCVLCGEAFPCLTLRLLALPHADHSDYGEAWRP